MERHKKIYRLVSTVAIAVMISYYLSMSWNPVAKNITGLRNATTSSPRTHYKDVRQLIICKMDTITSINRNNVTNSTQL